MPTSRTGGWQADVVPDTATLIDQVTDLRETQTSSGLLRYYDVGDGPVLLFLHGSGPGVTGWRNFRGVLPTFAQRFRCLILEFPHLDRLKVFRSNPFVRAVSYGGTYSSRMGR
jgi:pimeloyl-ACP methyl ester carboxylesterase